MTEKQLKKLKFKKVRVSKKEAGGAPFYYYIWDLDDLHSLSLISCASDEQDEDRGWYVEIFGDATCRWYKKKTLKKLIDILTKAKHTKLLIKSMEELSAPSL